MAPIRSAALASGEGTDWRNQMNQKLIRVLSMCGIAGVALSDDAQAQSSVTIYGLIDVGVEYSRAGSRHGTRMVSGGSAGSRVGYRGVEDLGGGLSTVFLLEQGINADDGTIGQGGRPFGRESSIGLSSNSVGTVQFGRLPTPYYRVAAAGDAFQWMGAGGITALTRSAASTIQVVPMAVNARHDNAVAYVSPKWGGIEVRAMYSHGERSAALGSGYGVSGRYTTSNLDLAAGYTRQNAGTAGAGSADAAVVAGSYDLGLARVYAGYTLERNDCTSCTGPLIRPAGVTPSGSGEFRIINIGTRVPLGAFTGIVQFVRIQDRTQYAVNPGDRDANWFAIGGEYVLSKRTLLYATVGSISNDRGSQYTLGTGSSQRPAGAVPATDPRSTTLNFGMRHIF
jgi:predicted porin